MTSSKSNHLQKAPSPNASHWGLGPQHMNLMDGGHGPIHSTPSSPFQDHIVHKWQRQKLNPYFFKFKSGIFLPLKPETFHIIWKLIQSGLSSILLGTTYDS